MVGIGGDGACCCGGAEEGTVGATPWGLDPETDGMGPVGTVGFDGSNPTTRLTCSFASREKREGRLINTPERS